MLGQSHHPQVPQPPVPPPAPARQAEATPVLAVRGLSKVYPGVQALDQLNLDVRSGEIFGIVGQNGAGKSTLIRMLAGADRPDSGEIRVAGNIVELRTPIDAQRAGIFTIFQELSLIAELSVAENIFLNDMPRGSLGTISWRRMRAEAQQAVDWLGFSIDVARPVRSLTVAQKQAVELAKALHRQARVVLLDEPSATLPPPDVRRLFDVMRSLRDQGLTLIYISHRMEEVFEICSRVGVMRDGRNAGTYEIANTTPAEIVRAMIGRDVRTSMLAGAEMDAKPRLGDGGGDDVVFSVQGLGDGAAIEDISFEVRRGEILGVAGLIGNGQPELAACLFGARPSVAGTIMVDGAQLALRSPADAIRAGVGLLPEERKTQGLILGMAVDSNISMASHERFSRLAILDRARERRTAGDMAKALGMKITSVGQPASTLSGGTQQKVVLAKWLISQSKVLIFSEPTRGVDVGAKEEIYGLIADFARQGGAVVLISSELREVIMCDRVLVMARGRVVGELRHDDIDPHGESVLALCH